MEPKQLPGKKGPEAIIKEALITYLEQRGWIVKVTHGSIYQNGLPDLYCTHRIHGPRWVEVKLPNMTGSKFTKAQNEWFPKLSANGTKIWILTAATDVEYKKLFEPENWFTYYLLKD